MSRRHSDAVHSVRYLIFLVIKHFSYNINTLIFFTTFEKEDDSLVQVKSNYFV